jgi:UDP-N-acetylmuramate dehydrogenase
MDGEMVTLSNTECEFHYRDSVFKHSSAVILSATLALREGDSKLAFKQAIDNLQYRNQTQPQGYASIGCTFKNLEYDTFADVIQKHDQAIPDAFRTNGKIPAGWLVDQSGMKGTVVGNAEVSQKHGNFIINKKGATAADVLSLIAQIKERVYHKYGVELEEEIQII